MYMIEILGCSKCNEVVDVLSKRSCHVECIFFARQEFRKCSKVAVDFRVCENFLFFLKRIFMDTCSCGIKPPEVAL